MVEALIWVGFIFVGGGILALERRCLGQMAVVQPLVVCLIAGWIGKCGDAAIWLGSLLQLFSVGQARQGDWALSGVVAGATVLVASRLDVPLIAGGPRAIILVLIAILMGLGSKALDRRYSRMDGERLRLTSPWESENVVTSVESHVRRIIRRWLVVGGVAVTVGTGFSLVSVLGVNRLLGGKPGHYEYFAPAILALSLALALSTLARYRFVVWAGFSSAIAWVLMAL